MEHDSSLRYARDSIGFYIAASDHDLLSQVNQYLRRNGCIGIADSAGRLHFIVDGRQGSPYASRRILETAGRLAGQRNQLVESLLERMSQVVDEVLTGHQIRPELKGYRYLRCGLLLIGLDESKLRPITKNLYPNIAVQYKASVTQVERDIRYALQRSDLNKLGLTLSASICRLYQELISKAEESLLGECQSGMEHATGQTSDLMIADRVTDKPATRRQQKEKES